MAIPLLGILQGVAAVKKVVDSFKKKGKTTDKIEAAIGTLTEFTAAAEEDPEAAQILRDNELEMDRLYTERAKAALDVMKVEASSEDPWVRRARPMWLYAGMVVFTVQMIAFPFAGIKITEYIDVQVLNWFYSIIGAGYLGYGALRTYDKANVGMFRK
jgi:hypothetical protein